MIKLGRLKVKSFYTAVYSSYLTYVVAIFNIVYFSNKDERVINNGTWFKQAAFRNLLY